MSHLTPRSRRSADRALAYLWPPREQARILYYHSVHPYGELSHRPKAFTDQLRWLNDNGFHSLTLSGAGALLAGERLPKNTVVITFDDGYEDNLKFALPILTREGFQATFFVISALLGAGATDFANGYKLYPGLRMMTRDHLRELVGAGMEVGSHTRNHVHVRKTIKRSTSAMFEELRGSREDLEAILGKTVQVFAYPNGQKGVFSRTTREALAQAGYRYAVTTMWGGLTPGQDLLQLPRIEIRNTDSLADFARKMQGQYDFMSLYCRMATRSKRW